MKSENFMTYEIGEQGGKIGYDNQNSGIMNIFVKLCKGYCGADVVTEYQFHPKRKWRFDYAIPSHKIAIEVEGGAWIDGRHNRASGFLKDMEKYNAAAVLGWRLLRVTPQQLLTTATLQMVAAALSYEN